MLKIFSLADNFTGKKFLLSRAMAYIAENIAAESIPVDFADCIFVLPSAEAGRLFREKAAIYFQQYGGVTRLKTILPEQLLFNAAKVNCSDVQSLEEWFNILKNADPADFQSRIFPDVEYNAETLLSIAESFSKIRENILLESGLDSEDFMYTLPEHHQLRTKLNDYVKLEKLYLEKLNSRTDKAQVIKNTLSSPFDDFTEIKKIILIENSELRGGIKKMLDKLAEKIEVIHLVNTTADELENFDIHGCPLTAKMMALDLPFEIEKQLRTFSNPIREAEKVVSLLDKNALPVSIGVMDNELAITLTHLLEEKNIEVYAPSVKMLKSFYWSKLFLAVNDLRRKNIPYEDVYRLAADDAFIKLFQISDCITVRKQIEKMQRDHLIQNLDSLKFFADRYRKNEKNCNDYAETCQFCDALLKLAERVRKVPSDSMPEGLWDIFAEIAACAPLENMDINEAEISLEALKNAVVSVRNITERGTGELIFKHKLAQTPVAGTEMYKDDALNFSGFLDLIWYENPTLILSGISEEAFSSSAVEDAFFPEQIRNELNWSSAYKRFGADIHRFEQLLKQYSSEEFFITFSAASKSGELHTAPRLFFNVNDEQLLKNCKLIFKSELTEKTLPEPEKKPLKYSSHITDKMPSKISVTAFKKYIECPYTFYLTDILNCNDSGRELFELQANQNGSILHAVLENYGKSFAEIIPDAEELKKYCMQEFERQFYNCAGFAPNNLALMQNEELSKNIIAFAEYEYNLRKSLTGHKIIGIEKKIDISVQSLINRLPQEYISEMPQIAPECADIRIVGKIDRIDSFYDSTNKHICRIIDYKSSKDAALPAAEHLTKHLPAHLEHELLIAGTDAKDKILYFSNMQLIIYSLFGNFMRSELNISDDAVIQCGYYNLPLNVKDTAVEIFNELDDSMLRKGAAALVNLINRIFAERRFWPPSLKHQYGVALKYLSANNTEDFEEEVQK